MLGNVKKAGLLILFFSILISFLHDGQAQAAGKSTTIFLDGKKLDLPGNVEVQIVNNSVMIPIRVVIEELGFTVGWEQKARSITIKARESILELFVGNQTAIVQGIKKTLIAAPIIQSGTTLVPLRFVSEEMGLTVGWDNIKKEVTLKSNKPIVIPNLPPATGNDSNPGNDGNTVEAVAQVNDISFFENRLVISTIGMAKPHVFTMSDPNRIVIDLPHTTFSTSFQENALNSALNGAFKVVDYPDVANIRFSLFSNHPPTVRIVMDLNVAKGYDFYYKDDNPNVIVVDLNATGGIAAPPPTDTNSKRIVVIDAGHGGHDPGATGISGRKEKDFNLAVALKVQQLLIKENDIEVVLTRYNDTYIDLGKRGTVANGFKADAFISIHANAMPNSATVRGSESFYYQDSSISFATVMHKHLLAATGFIDRKVKYASLRVLRDASMAAVLLEVGFLTNATEEAILYTESFQNRVAQGIVNGLKEYFG